MSKYSASTAARLAHADYFPFVLASIEAALRRIWVMMFIQDIRPQRDLEGQVLELTMALVEQRRVGIDVRVLLSGQVTTPDIEVANVASGLLLREYGVEVRRVFADQGGARFGTHAKFVIVDDVVVVGSQNWTDDAFRVNIEDAAILTGPPSEMLAAEFTNFWAVGKALPQHAAH